MVDTVNCTDTDVSVASEGRALTVPWAHLVGAHACRYDLKYKHATVVVLEHESGHVLEVWDDAAGWSELIRAVAARSPLGSEAVVQALQSLRVDDEPLVLFRVARGGAASA